ncbi:MAG TPA: cytochrome c, partial [Actinomycetota bacterium]|nr:cytochrome c [Actinomycetota bacterium]
SSTTEIAEAIRVGPGTMPRFGSDSLDDSQMNDVVAYVDYLQDSADPGGFSLGRVGPVTEGLVGWVLGLGLLIVVIRWIGTKADE